MKRLAVIAGFVAGVLGAAAAVADSDGERARRAVEAGLIRPLAEALARVEEHFVGTVIEVELEDEDRRYVYDIKLLAPHGDVIEVEMDAVSLDILEVEGHDVDHARRHR